MVVQKRGQGGDAEERLKEASQVSKPITYIKLDFI